MVQPARSPALTFNIDDHFCLEMVVNVERQEKYLSEIQANSEKVFHDKVVHEMKERLGQPYNSFNSLC